jgi:hypothetical protein
MHMAKFSSHVGYSLALATLVILGATSTVAAQKPKPVSESAAKAIRADKQAKTAAKAADKTEDRAEKAAKKEFKGQRKALLKGIALSATEKKAAKDVEKRYDDQFKALEKEEGQAAKAGQPMPDVVQRIEALRDRERADLRAVLTPAHLARFDENVTHFGHKK